MISKRRAIAVVDPTSLGGAAHRHGVCVRSAVLFRFIFLFLTAAGVGAWSVDAAPRRKTPAVT
jgi:hypothetical protein